jgi:hypothetical protein
LLDRYRTGLRSAGGSAALPYGYTVTMWSSGQVLIHFHGAPTLPLVWLFAGGALAAFGLLQLATRSAHAPAQDLQFGDSANWLRAGAIQAIAVATSLTAVTAAGSLLPPALSWLVGGMATVVGYLGITGLENALQAAPDASPDRADGL